jgi:hypothetical protein
MMSDVFLTGTTRVEVEKTLIQAGKLEATYDSGALRWIKWNGVEVLRAIMFLVRTPGWGTPAAKISNLRIADDCDSFSISYDAHYGEAEQGVWVHIAINGNASGSLSASATISAEVPFETNRSGFVVLHPLDGFAGTEVVVDHVNADPQTLIMPLQISPGQPLMDIKSITHRPVSGLTVETLFEGDVFEMEDHRNWSDASFKTYNRPIGLPYPYFLSPDEPVNQAVNVHISDNNAVSKVEASIASPEIKQQKMPSFALPLDSLDDVEIALNNINAILALRPASFLLRFDRTIEKENIDFSNIAKLLNEVDAALELQIILSSTSDHAVGEEIYKVRSLLDSSGVKPARVSAFAKIDEQSFQPGQERPAHPSEEAIAQHLGVHFSDALLIGGTPAFFTELNRKRPDPKLWKGISFATTPVVHAADDASVMETLQSLPHILSSAVKLAGDIPISVGPTGIGARLNPYGPAPSDNHPEEREGMAAQDPRQRGLFAAAWVVGYLTRIAPFAPERFSFAAPTGPFGLLSTRQKYSRTYWDDQPEGLALPIFHVAKWINQAGGATLLSAKTVNGIAQLDWVLDGKKYSLMANLSAESKPLLRDDFSGFEVIVLDETSVKDCALSFQIEPSIPFASVKKLDAYAVLFARQGGEQ